MDLRGSQSGSEQFRLSQISKNSKIWRIFWKLRKSEIKQSHRLHSYQGNLSRLKLPNRCIIGKWAILHDSSEFNLCPREEFIFQRGDNVSHWLNSSFEFLSEAKKTKNHEAFYLCDSSSTSLRQAFKILFKTRLLIGAKAENFRLIGWDVHRVRIILKTISSSPEDIISNLLYGEDDLRAFCNEYNLIHGYQKVSS